MDSFLAERGIHAIRSHGLFNSAGDIVMTLAEHPAPYIFVTASAIVIRAALRAFAETHKKRIVIRDERGNRIDATNYSVEELKKLAPSSLIEIDD